MRTFLTRLVFLLLALAAFSSRTARPEHGPARLDSGRVGVYGADFEFTTLSVIKESFEAAGNPGRLARVAERLRRNHELGRFNLFGLYVADRLKYARPLDECLRAACTIVAGVGRRRLDAVFLSEENVPSKRGIAVLNGLYDGLKRRWPDLPVFQWLSAPLGPAPDLKADGWVYDFYGRRRAEFRRKITRYLVTGKPLVMCLNASPMAGRFADSAGVPATREQLEVCREFDLPVFFFCVDSHWGNPDIWRISNAPEITAWRNWLLRAVGDLRRVPPAPDMLSSEYVDGASVEAAPDASGGFEFQEHFRAPTFLDHWSVRGFRNIVWSGKNGGCLVFRRCSRIFQGAELYCHIVSEFEMRDPTVDMQLGAGGDGGRPRLALLLSATGHDWPRRGKAWGKRQNLFRIDARGDKRFRTHEYWLQVRTTPEFGNAHAVAPVIRRLRFACRMTPPEKPGVVLRPARDGTVHYRDRFLSRKYLWRAKVEHPDAIHWQPGRLSLGGVRGRANRAVLVWPFSCKRALRNIRVELDARANQKNLGGVVRLSISRDGKQWGNAVKTSQFPADANGWRAGTLTVDSAGRAALREVHTFFVRVELVNTCGLKTPASDIITRLEVWGRVR